MGACLNETQEVDLMPIAHVMTHCRASAHSKAAEGACALLGHGDRGAATHNQLGKFMKNLLIYLVIAAVIASILLGIYGLLWLLWRWALPQVWPSGPVGIIAPAFWVFSACWFLVTGIGKAIFGRQ